MSNIFLKNDGSYVQVSNILKKTNNSWTAITENELVSYLGQKVGVYGGTIVTTRFEIGAPSSLTAETCSCIALLNNVQQTSGVTWSITSGSTYASISNAGVLTINSNADNSTITIQAVYSQYTATHTMTVTGGFYI